jgi:hypothetical protein
VPQVPIDPNTNLAWPTLVLEMGYSETVASLRRHRAEYLSNQTGVNVHVAIGYNRNSTPADDTWYVSVYARDMNPPNPPPGAPPNWSPPPVQIFDSQPNIGGHYNNLNVGPVNWVANIPIDLLWYPQTLPNPLPPGVPQQITLTFENLRQTILLYRLR